MIRLVSSKTAITDDGETSSKNIYQLDESKILEESMYDGFYAVITNLEEMSGKSFISTNNDGK